MMTFDEALRLVVPPGSVVRYVANKGNAGDALIAESTRQAFARCGVFEGGSGVAFVAGSGGLAPQYQCTARAIDRINREHRVVIGPSTVSDHWELLRSFPNLILMARDEMTRKLAELNRINVIPVHDAAFGFDFSEWTDAGEGTLCAMRTDSESAGGPLPEGNQDVSTASMGWWLLDSSGPAARRFVTRISRYRNVVTDRLHVAIVAAMLGKEVEFRAGCYFKNRAVFESSLSGKVDFA